MAGVAGAAGAERTGKISKKDRRMFEAGTGQDLEVKEQVKRESGVSISIIVDTKSYISQIPNT